jgi:uncharacterized coiled-coil protein SlyX
MDDELVHVYDPEKRRAYYLKTRQLKGRKTGTLDVSKSRPRQTQQERRKQRQRQLEAQVAALRARLEKLQEALKLLTKQAKARSGVKTTEKKNTSSDSKSSNDRKSSDKSTSRKKEHLTASQKAKEAKAQAKYYQKTKNEQLADEVKSLTAKLKTIQERIAKMRKSGAIASRAKS